MATEIKKQTASDVVVNQHTVILEAIAMLQKELDDMTVQISPSTSSWLDVSKFAHVADIAQMVVSRIEECR